MGYGFHFYKYCSISHVAIKHISYHKSIKRLKPIRFTLFTKKKTLVKHVDVLFYFLQQFPCFAPLF